MKDNDEFKNKPFYPNRFYWKYSDNEDTLKACQILNKLTKQQIWAVEVYGESRYADGDSDGRDYESFED